MTEQTDTAETTEFERRVEAMLKRRAGDIARGADERDWSIPIDDEATCTTRAAVVASFGPDRAAVEKPWKRRRRVPQFAAALALIAALAVGLYAMADRDDGSTLATGGERPNADARAPIAPDPLEDAAASPVGGAATGSSSTESTTTGAPANSPAGAHEGESSEATLQASSGATPQDLWAAAPPRDGTLARLVIPAIDVDLFVFEGTDAEALRGQHAGHVSQSAYPGREGNAAIAGHRTTYGAPFHRLDELAVDDSLFIITDQGSFEYIVSSISVIDSGSDLGTAELVEPGHAVLDDFGDTRLTLITEHPKYSDSQRLVVVGKLVGPPAPDRSTGEAVDE